MLRPCVGIRKGEGGIFIICRGKGTVQCVGLSKGMLPKEFRGGGGGGGGQTPNNKIQISTSDKSFMDLTILCRRYFIDERSLKVHFKSKPHKRRYICL